MTDANVESVYPLSPTQEGMLFHTLYAEESRVYFEQVTTSFRGPVDAQVLKRAWQRVVDRHAILRTLFVWEGQKKPLQVVRRRVALDWGEEDWRGRSPAEQEEALDAFLRADRDRGFEIAKVPPLRLRLIRIADEEHHFVWSFHHLLLDGWSVAVLNREVVSCYAAFVRGAEPELPPVPPYRDYIQWLQTQPLAKAESFWRRQLAGFTTPTRLRGAPGPASGTSFREEHRELPEAMSGALQAFARQHRLTLGTVFQAAWALLLSRHSGEDDVVLGAAFSGRPPELPGIESMVGLFLGTLPVRVLVRRDEPFLRWVKELQDVQFELHQHQHVPLVQLQAWSDVPRGVPLFESLVVFENYPMDQAPGPWPPGVAITGFRFWAHTNYPLHLKVSPGPRFYVSLTYDASRYDAATIRDLLSQVPTVLEQVLARPEAPLHRVSLVTPESRAVLPDPSVLLAEEEFPPVTALFERWVRRSPREPALSQGGRSLSYEGLSERARSVADALRSGGLEPGQVVAIDGRPGFGLITSLLGVLFAGGVALIADRKLPAERRRLMCREASAKYFVRLQDEGAAEERWWEEDIRDSLSVDLASGWVRVTSAGSRGALPELDDETGAYVFFTSGTTGVPKGVLGTHRGLSHFVSWQRATFGVGPGDRSSQLTGLSFDVVLREIFLPLTSGATLCLPEEADERGPERVLPWLERERITVLHTVPTLAQTWLRDPPRAASLKALRLVFFAGEPLGGGLVGKWRETFGVSATIVNLYGPTETTLAKCFYVVPSEPGEAVQPVGRPLPQSQALVLAGGGRLCGVGEWGEIVIRTPYCTRGYVNFPDESRRRFRPNPFRSDDRDLLYLTGDRGRFRADGALEISGRLDDQVKVRGARVEPAEIASILGQHPAVRQCAIVGQDGDENGVRLLAYVVPEKAARPAADELKGFLRARIPDYMVPSAFVLLEALPLTANGKLDRRALPVPEAPAPGPAAFPVAPRAPIEEELAAIWREVLRLETVGAHDDFFQLGGHSLLATQVMSRIRCAFAVELPIRSLYETPTIAGLAAAVEGSLGGGDRTPPPVIVPGDGEQPRPLSFAQQRLWFLDQVVPGTPAYNIPGALRLVGDLERAALEKALAEIVRRHEVLRSTIAVDAGRPFPRVSPPERFVLATLDLHELPESRRNDEMLRLARDEAVRPFDLEAGPLFRSTLVRVREREHVLLVTLHHIVSDAWSLGVIVHELGTLYEAYAAGRPSPLPELTLQYADFAEGQRRWLEGPVLDSQLSYWRGRLSGPLPVLDLPTDHPRPPVQSFRGAHHALPLSRELTEELRALSRREGCTLFMTLLAAYGVLLLRYTGQEDILVGIPVAGRNRKETEGVVGLFVNTLVVRLDLSGNPSFQTLLGRVRETALGAYAHADLPFEKLVESLQPDRELSRNPVVQTMVVLQNTPMPALRMGGLELHPLLVPRQIARFDLTLFAMETAEGLLGGFEYSADLFEPATVARMGGHWRRLLEEAASAPDRRVRAMPLLDEPEERSVRALSAGPRLEYPREATVHEEVARQAHERPDAVAVVCGRERVSYAELDRRANQLAHHLRRLGVGPEVRVGICVERSAEMVVGLLGILKAGGAYLPLDPSYPRERLAFMLDDAAAPVLVTQDRLRPVLPGTRSRVLCLDADKAAIARERDSAPGIPVTERNLAYVIYTSGSTGRPKGVEVEHGGLANLTAWHRRVYGVEGTDRATLLADLSFDASVWELWPYLTGGASVHVPTRPEVRTSAPRLLEWLEASRITLSFLPTPLADAVLREPLPEGLALRALLTGGDMLRRRPSAVPFELVNHYGPTEGTVVSTWTVVKSEGEEEGAPPIGRPVDNTRAYVLDEQLRILPVGLPGELYVGGAGLARGYLNRPDLTAERFVPDPLGTEPGGRLYRTGDRVRYRSDGSLEFLGRQDDQVKIRGFRIELGEIGSALGRHPAVQAAVVVAREERGGDKQLVAYVVSRPDAAVTAADLRTALQETLPSYMVPPTYVFLDALPLSPSGKVDRRALATREFSRAHLEAPYVAPRSPVEETIAGIWSEVLGVPLVGAKDNFFEQGGHSLLATQTLSRMRETLRVELPLRALFEAPTVEGLAKAVEAARRGGPDEATPALRRVGRDGELPLSFAQQRLWFLDQMRSGAAYNIPWALRLRGPLDAAALQASLDGVVRRHEALRTTFPARQGRPTQVIAPELRIPVREVDLRGMPEAEREPAAQRIVTEEAQRLFDLASGPLVRASLVRLAEDDHVLVLTIHHIVADGWSMGVLSRELTALYRAFTRGEASPLAELPVQYADFSHWQREWLQGEALERQLSYWKDRLDRVPTLHLPTDRPRPPLPTYRGAIHFFALPPALSERLKATSLREGATLFMTLLTGFQALLCRYSGEEDVVVGSPIANRHRHAIEGLIGFFVNSLALRTDLSGDPTFREALRRVRETALGAYDHQDLPFEKLVEELQPERDLSRNPLFQVNFALQNAPWAPLELGPLHVGFFGRDVTTTRFDLELNVWEHEARLGGAFYYSTDLFDAPTIARMAGNLQTLLEAAVEGPERRLSDLPLLSEGERRELLVEWNATDTRWPRAAGAHRLFEEQAARAPERTALVAREGRLDYRGLNARANHLAHRLRELKVGPESRVGIFMERSAEMVVGLLGVLKAGAAYVPVDPSYPAERQAYMLRDAGAAVILTQPALQERAPETGALVLVVEREGEKRDEGPLVVVEPENLAYVIYTSGSTGRPKGAMVSHAGLRNYLSWAAEAYSASGGRGSLVHSPLAFDLTVTSLLLPLVRGESVELLPEGDVDLVADRLRHGDEIGLLKITPAHVKALGQLLGSGDGARWARMLIVGGEALHGEDLQRLRVLSPGTWIVNEYGPTETVVGCCAYAVQAGEVGAGPVPIGRPIANTRLYVLDRYMSPVPPGVPGELFIGGAGVGRGYWSRPDLTAERFLPCPFGNEPGERLFRTGDLVRHRADGVLEYLGRLDHQVKVRGYRIEPGEVEMVLAEHPSVAESAVLAREDAPGDKRLVAYVVARSSAPEAAASQGEQVLQWQALYEETYAQAQAPPDPAFNVVGWNSSYTGLPIPSEQMREWVDRTAERILASSPKRVLEIGCGSGLLLFRIAPRCERYVGTDFSRAAIRLLEGELAGAELPQVALWHRPADVFDGVDPASFDAVVLNSVVQYFPSVEYLMRVLEGAVRAVAPGGQVFVGDVRSLPLLEAYHASVETHRAPASWSREDLGDRVRKQLAQEEELVIDPDFFAALKERLPRIRQAVAQLKRGRHHNELTRFRYDVILRIGGEEFEPGGEESLDWQARGLTVSAVERLLRDREPEALRLVGVPDARLVAERTVLEWLRGVVGPATVGELRERMAGEGADGVDPEALWSLAGALPYDVDIGTHGPDGRFDVVLRRREGPRAERAPVARPSAARSARDWSRFANDPLRGLLVRRLVPELGRFLEGRLPVHMLPSAFVVLDALPLTPHGKVDRGALPAPDRTASRTGDVVVAPRSPTEVVVANAFALVLGLKEVSIHDRFFDLGGHSLLATQVVSRLRDALQVEVPLRLLFEEPTVAGLAAALLADPVHGARVAEVADVLLKVAHLSEDEAESLLAGGQGHSA